MMNKKMKSVVHILMYSTLAIMAFICIYLFKLGIFVKAVVPGNVLIIGLTAFLVGCMFLNSMNIWNLARVDKFARWIISFSDVTMVSVSFTFIIVSLILISNDFYNITVNGTVAVAMLIVLGAGIVLNSLVQGFSIEIIGEKYNKRENEK